MCGICGFFSIRGAFDEAVLRRMNATIERRGPDGEGLLHEGPVGIAMRRLAIIDLKGGGQPIFNEDRSVAVVFNGEIYNYPTLRRDLEARGHVFATHSDTEAIVHLYEEHGPDCVAHLEGMFAIALWDRKRRRLLLARDPLGIKPLFVADRSDGLVFGSEIKAVRASGSIDDTPDAAALDQYMTYSYVPHPRTIYRSIRKLAPGSYLLIDEQGQREEKRYWSPRHFSPLARAPADHVERCEQLLKDAVASHLLSDVPVGAFLSGGVDSSIVVALAAQATQKPIQSFTVGFQRAGGSFLDERPYARMMAERYGLEHREIDVEPRITDIIGEISNAFDEPFADDSVVPSYYVSQVAARHVKVALTGLGGDELFGGYTRYVGLGMSESYMRIPGFLRNSLVRPIVRSLPEPKSGSDFVDRLKRFVASDDSSAAARYESYLRSTDADSLARLYSPELGARLRTEAEPRVMAQLFDALNANGAVDGALRTDLETYLVDDILTLTDRLSMWHSLELRVPFLDKKLVEYVVALPPGLKVRGRQTKWLLKRIAAKWLPAQVIHHRKQGFESPMGMWLRGPLLGMFRDIVTPVAVRDAGMFRHDTIATLLDEHVRGVRKHSRVLFCVLMAQMWAQSAKQSTRNTLAA